MLFQVKKMELEVKQTEKKLKRMELRDPLIHPDPDNPEKYPERIFKGFFPYDDPSMEGFDRWMFVKRLGAGSFGIVYKARRLSSNTPTELAVKIFPKAELDKVELDRAEAEAKKEYDIMSYLVKEGHGECVVNTYGHGLLSTEELPYLDNKGRKKEGSLIYFVSEELMDGDLEDFWDRVYVRHYKDQSKKKELLEFLDQLYKLFYQLIYCIGLIHDSGIVLKDIKPPNILYKEVKPGTYRFKYSDVGLSCKTYIDFIDRGIPSSIGGKDKCEESGFSGTRVYSAPELEAREEDAIMFSDNGEVLIPGKRLDYLTEENRKKIEERNKDFKTSDYWALGMTILQVLIANRVAYYFPSRGRPGRQVSRKYQKWGERLSKAFLQSGIATMPELTPKSMQLKTNKKIMKYLTSLMNSKEFGRIALLIKDLLTVDPVERMTKVKAILRQ